ncbi:MAG: OmpA family protein [Pseudomonadota bacterium]
MALTRGYLVASAFLIGAALSLVAATLSAQLVEENTETEVRYILDRNGLTWAEVEADGLRVVMTGTAPTEALRFRALSLTGSMVDATRIIDEMTVAAVAEIDPPRFSAEVLRNSSGLTIVGLIPQSSDRDAIIDGFSAISETNVTDLLETADYPAPSGWDDALAYAIEAIEDLPRAKVSVRAGRVAITAIAEDAEDKAKMEQILARRTPPSLRVRLDITAPRPVISPFALRFVKDETGAQFDTCSADTLAAQTQILEAAMRAGLTGTGRCAIGMGVPTPTWAEAVTKGMDALTELGAGSITFSDADVTLTAAEGADPGQFDRVIGELEAALPEVFVLNAVLPRTEEDSDSGPAEFVATLSPEGQVQLRGRINDAEIRNVADSFAKSKFGSDSVYTAARIVPNLPGDWPTRVIAGIESLSYLDNGAVTVKPDHIAIAGRSGNSEASDAIARLYVDKLGDGASIEIDITYVEALDPVAALPTPEECETRIAAIIEGGKISFEPSSTTIDESALTTMDLIAEALADCEGIRLEVQGHTDSQGREEMNLSLSQARAESVLNELRARRVLTSGFVAVGYGETQPIADNDTEEGREANRRIAFRLVRPNPSIPEGETGLESLAESGDTDEEDDTQ